MTRLALLAALLAPLASAQPSERYAEDVEALWRFVADEYVYLDEAAADWDRALDRALARLGAGR